jgi:hypothetical protein
MTERKPQGGFKEMKNKLVLTFGVIFVVGLILAGCDNPAGSNNNGILTINNCPSIATVIICDSNPPATTVELIQVISAAIAVGEGTKSPYALKNKDGSAFTRTGSFLVVVTANSNNYFKGDVSFNNGSATLDFAGMTSQADLPAN